MKFFILIISFLFPFALAYLIKTTQISIFVALIIIILFTILIISYLSKNNKYAQFSLKNFFFKTKNHQRTHHIHLVQIDSTFWKRHLAFRNHLRENQKELAAERSSNK